VTKTRLTVGDVFQIPVDDARFGYGQAVGKYGEDAYYLAVFDGLFDSFNRDDPCAVAQGPVVFLALSFDAKVAVGDWTIRGHCAVATEMPLPAYREMVGGPDRIDVVDFSGTRRRLARQHELQGLPNRLLVAPVRLEMALKARYGLEPWLDVYTALEPSSIATTARLFGQ
jgi:hypothetical protein